MWDRTEAPVRELSLAFAFLDVSSSSQVEGCVRWGGRVIRPHFFEFLRCGPFYGEVTIGR